MVPGRFQNRTRRSVNEEFCHCGCRDSRRDLIRLGLCWHHLRLRGRNRLFQHHEPAFGSLQRAISRVRHPSVTGCAPFSNCPTAACGDNGGRAAGGVFGLLASFWLSYLLRFQHIDPKLDWRLYAMAFSGSLLLGIFVGLAPALRSSGKDLTESLKEGGLATGGRTQHLFRNFLAVSELVMASVLCLVGALMTRSIIEFYRGELGFEPERLVSVKVQPRRELGWTADDQIAYVERGLQALRKIPGVERASLCIGHFMPRFVPKEDIRLADVSRAMASPIREAITRLDVRQPVNRPETITGLLERRAADALAGRASGIAGSSDRHCGGSVRSLR